MHLLWNSYQEALGEALGEGLGERSAPELNHSAGPKSGEEERMTIYNLIGDDSVVVRGTPHVCTSDLAQLRARGSVAWQCTVCHNPVFIEEVVEMLRERAVAQDAALRLQFLRGTPDPVPSTVRTVEHAYFAPLISPKKLREQGGL